MDIKKIIKEEVQKQLGLVEEQMVEIKSIESFIR